MQQENCPTPSCPGPDIVHISGSSVNLPDMSATLRAKVTASEEEQADPAALALVYDGLAQRFSNTGLNLDAVAAMRQYFSGTEDDSDAPPQPLAYAAFPSPLPDAAVRLCVAFFQRRNPELAELVEQAAAEVVAALPPGTKSHLNHPGHYHITVFMTSQPHTIRPDPFDPGAVPPADIAPAYLAAALQPTPDTVRRETEVMAAAAAATPPPSFAVHRLVLADSGTLLLCSVDTSGQLAGLRRRLKDAFPGAPPRQSTICHASIARVLSPRQLDADAIRRLQEVCDRWTERVRGMTFDAPYLYYIREQTFTTVEGPCVSLPFAGSPPLGCNEAPAAAAPGNEALAGR